MLVLAVIGPVSLQHLSILGNSFNSSIDKETLHLLSSLVVIFLTTTSKLITQRLHYAHFLPLANNTKLHQVKVIVDYTPASLGQYAYMKVCGPDRTSPQRSTTHNIINCGIKYIKSNI
jgi:hypothetical protein